MNEDVFEFWFAVGAALVGGVLGFVVGVIAGDNLGHYLIGGVIGAVLVSFVNDEADWDRNAWKRRQSR